MNIIDKLMSIEQRIYELRLRKSKKVFLTSREIGELMRKGEPIPTNIFNAEKKDYIVKARTIFGPKPRKQKERQ